MKLEIENEQEHKLAINFPEVKKLIISTFEAAKSEIESKFN